MRVSGIALRAPVSVAELVARLGGEADAPALRARVARIVPPDHAEDERDLVPFTHARFTAHARRAPGVLLVSPALAPRVEPGRRWRHPHASWVVACLLEEVDGAGSFTEHRPELACISPQAALHPEVVVGAGAVVMAGVAVGAGSVLGEGSVLYPRVRLGQRVRVGPNTVIGRPGFGHALGPDGALRRVPQLGGVVVEDDVEIGALCTIDAGTLGPTVIGAGCRLDAQVHVGHNAVLGEGVLIAAQSGLAGSARLGRGVRLGGQSGVADHVVVGDGASVAARSAAVGDVPPGETVAGFPAVPRARFLRATATLLRLSARRRR